MELLIGGLIGGLCGVILGVVLEDSLIRLKARFLRFIYRWFIYRWFRKPFPIPTPFHFSFGPIDTAEVIVDGDGETTYTPSTIICHYDGTPIPLPPELQEIKEKIENEEEQKKRNGERYMWNDNIYALRRFTRGRTADEDNLEINLWFGPSDWFTYCATNARLDTQYVGDPNTGQKVTFREKYFANVDWSSPSLQPITHFGNTFGVNASLITADERLILVRRSQEVTSWKGMYHVAINEGVQRDVDRAELGDAPDLYRTVIRGAGEELGLDLLKSDITFLTFNVNTKQSEWSMHGFARTAKTVEEVIDSRRLVAKDKWEGMEFIPINFNLKDVITFVHTHNPWTSHGLACTYYTLVHEFKRTPVNKAIRRYMY